jgi:hypothetical protein
MFMSEVMKKINSLCWMWLIAIEVQILGVHGLAFNGDV